MKKKPIISREQMLRSTVLPHPHIEVERINDDIVKLGIPLPSAPLLKWFPKLGDKPATVKKVELDEVGTFVWEMCDGETSVSEMINLLVDEYKMNPKEAEVSLFAYVRTLMAKNIASVVILEEED